MTDTMRTMWSEWESVRGELRDQLVEAGAERRRLTEEVRPESMMIACLLCRACFVMVCQMALIMD